MLQRKVTLSFTVSCVPRSRTGLSLVTQRVARCPGSGAGGCNGNCWGDWVW